MQTTTPQAQSFSEPSTVRVERSGWAVGWIAFAGIVMLTVGAFHVLTGIVDLVNSNFVVTLNNYTYRLNVTSWGWIHIILGAVMVLAGIGVFMGNVAARTVGVVLAVLSAIAAFMWLPYQPVWSAVIIAIDVAVIWALTTHGRDVVEA